jgi:hypothetical protein
MTGERKDAGNSHERHHEPARPGPGMMTAGGAHYAGWLIGFLQVDPATGTAAGILLEDPAAPGPAAARWEPGRQYVVRQVPEADGAWCRCLPVSIYPQDPPATEAVLVTSPAWFSETDPAPAVAAWAPGTDGAGPALLAADGTPARWVLLDGYVYEIRDDLHQPPWQTGRWSVSEWRPQAITEMTAIPPDRM